MKKLPSLLLGLALLAVLRLPAAPSAGAWVGTWVSAQQLTEPKNMPPQPGLQHTTLRQIIQMSIGGPRIRLSFSNVFGHAPLHLVAVHVAKSAGGGAIDPATDQALTFHGNGAVTIEPGASMISDPLDFPITAFEQLAVSIKLEKVPDALTGHPGSRQTSFYQEGDYVTAVKLPEPQKIEHWYFLSGVDVWNEAPAAAVVTLGDSITDGRGSTTDHNDRWPDDLAHRLRENAATANVAVLNQGIGGNRLLRDGLGPNALSRFDRDVLAPPGVKWLIVFEGINDLGTAAGARAHGWPAATAQDIIAALEQIALRAHAHGIKVFGTTITPYEGCFYFSKEGEADRQTVNNWIRTGGAFDGVIDFDAIARDPANPSHLSAAVDGGDHLHPSAAGYHLMSNAIDLALFEK